MQIKRICKEYKQVKTKELKSIVNIIENMELTGAIYLLRYSKGYASIPDELLNEKALINNADCSAYATEHDSICTLEDAIEYYESIGYEIYKLTNIQVEHLTK